MEQLHEVAQTGAWLARQKLYRKGHRVLVDYKSNTSQWHTLEQLRLKHKELFQWHTEKGQEETVACCNMENSTWTSGKVVFTMRLVKHSPTSKGGHEISIFGADLSGQNPEEPNINSKITLLWVKGWIRWPLEFYSYTIFFTIL